MYFKGHVITVVSNGNIIRLHYRDSITLLGEKTQICLLIVTVSDVKLYVSFGKLYDWLTGKGFSRICQGVLVLKILSLCQEEGVLMVECLLQFFTIIRFEQTY